MGLNEACFSVPNRSSLSKTRIIAKKSSTLETIAKSYVECIGAPPSIASTLRYIHESDCIDQSITLELTKLSTYSELIVLHADEQVKPPEASLKSRRRSSSDKSDNGNSIGRIKAMGEKILKLPAPPGYVHIKLSAHSRFINHEMEIRVSAHQPLENLKRFFSYHTGFPEKEFRFYYDGRIVEDSAWPELLNMQQDQWNMVEVCSLLFAGY